MLNRSMTAPQPPLRRSPLTRGLASAALRALGWRLEGELPPVRKLVLVCAPHTSRWDLWLTLLAGTALGVKVRWVGKHTLFWRPNGWLLTWLGGIPIVRSGGNDTVSQLVRRFIERDELVLVISPEGATRRTPYWRSGFWHIANQADVPLVVASLDWATGVCRVGPVIEPGDIAADMDQIRAALAHVVPRHPERFGPVRLEREGEIL